MFKSITDKLFPLTGGIIGSLNSLHIFVLPSFIPQQVRIFNADFQSPEIVRVLFFGFLGGLTGWLAKKFCDWAFAEFKRMCRSIYNKIKTLWQSQRLYSKQGKGSR